MLHLLLPLLGAAHAGLSTEDAQAILLIEAQRLPAQALESYVQHEDVETRARAALALGRLRDPDALGMLLELMEAPEAEVRAAAAFGVGLSPEGGAAAADLLAGEDDALVRARLLGALGLDPDPAHLPLLVEGLGRGALEAQAAATSLGRYGIAKVEGVDGAEVTDALAAQLTARIDPGARRAVAFALARISAVDLSAATVDALVRRARREHDTAVRAWLLRALGPALGDDPRGAALLEEMVKDPDSGVRIAAARAVPKMGGGSSPALLRTLMDDPLRAVRLTAIVAAGSTKGADHDALLTPLLQDEDPEVVATALSALHSAEVEVDARAWMKPEHPLLVRAAAISTLEDTGQLVRLATRSTEPSLRTAAAGTLLGASPSTADAVALLSAGDDVVAAVGAAILADAPDEAALQPLLALAQSTESAEVLGESLKALAAIAADVKKPPMEELSALVDLGGQHVDAPVRSAAAELAASLSLPAPPAPHHGALIPDLAEVERIVSARVMTDQGELRFTLRPDLAPVTVASFARLAEDDYFDGLSFHRVVPDFVIQDGCPRGDGWGGPGYTIPDELSWLPYDEGALGMALSGPDTGGSQWFVTLAPQPHLDANYTVFGELTAGQATLHRVQRGTVIEDVIIERVPEK